MTKTITLPSGKIATVRQGRGFDLLQAQIKAKTSEEIPYALIAELTEIDGQKLVYEDILELDLTDVIALQAELSGKFQSTAQPTAEEPGSGNKNKTARNSYYNQLPDSQCIIHLSKVTGWQYSELCNMPIPVLVYWCNQAIKYTNNRNEELASQC